MLPGTLRLAVKAAACPQRLHGEVPSSLIMEVSPASLLSSISLVCLQNVFDFKTRCLNLTG